jgi:group I intron endonuclease
MFVYKITNTQTQEFYIGQTIKNIEYRFRKHKEMSIRGGGYKLHNAMRKYGVENFIIEILDTATNLNELNEKEIHYIDTLKPYYNILPGGQIRLTENSIEKMRQSLTGKKHSQELIKKRFKKIRELENDKQFLFKRGKSISESKKKTYLIEDTYFTGIEDVAKYYGIGYSCARARIKSNSPTWKKWTEL